MTFEEKLKRGYDAYMRLVADEVEAEYNRLLSTGLTTIEAASLIGSKLTHFKNIVTLEQEAQLN